MPTPFTTDDLYLHRKISELHCLPGQHAVLATVRSVDREQDRHVACVQSFPFDGTPSRQLTHGPGSASSPRWSPRGDQLAFLSDREGGALQAFVLPCDGGEARQLSHFAKGAGRMEWSSDGRSLLVTAAVAVDSGLRGARAPDAAAARKGDAPQVCWRLPYKADGVGFILQREIHLFRIDAGGGEPQQLTDGPQDVQGFAPSPDGRYIAYGRAREGRFAHCTDLWVCDGDGGGHRRLTHDHPVVQRPTWSPDGRWIAFGGSTREGDGETGLFLLEFATGQVRRFGPEYLEVADPQSMCWDAAGTQLLLVRAHRGRHQIVGIALDDGLCVLAAGDRQFGAFATDGTRLAFAVQQPSLPSELVVRTAGQDPEHRLSTLNAWWQDRTPLRVETRRFQVPDGRGGSETIEGWLLRPEGIEGPLPLLSDIHGGPASYALLGYDANLYRQALCAMGWAVLLLNPAGSSSFGGAFCERLSGHWGELDLPQHQAAIRQLQDEGVCDGRVAIFGASYGGYFTSWAIGHCSMFRAAVVMCPVGNIETHYGTSDGGYYADPLYMATAPGFDRGRARELSPLQFIERATTPTLFIQGEADERTPKCQAEELFVSLYRAGDTPTEMVLYPGEGHGFLGVGKPSFRADAAGRIVEWICRHLERVPLPIAQSCQEAVVCEGAAVPQRPPA